MMFETECNLQKLAGGLRVKARVQHPKVTQRKDRPGWPWIFRYYADELQPDGSTKVLRRVPRGRAEQGRRRHHEKASGDRA